MSCQLIWSIPDDDAETRLRVRPIREQWEARGPGLLAHIQICLPWIRYPSPVTVRLTNPRAGGGGRVISSTEIELEAVLANPLPQLPEVARLAWLITTMATQRHTTAKHQARHAIGLIPATLEGAQHVELAVHDTLTTQCALDGWVTTLDSVPAAAVLLPWWRALQMKFARGGVPFDEWQHALGKL